MHSRITDLTDTTDLNSETPAIGLRDRTRIFAFPADFFLSNGNWHRVPSGQGIVVHCAGSPFWSGGSSEPLAQF
jgi:hypothetical protein